MEQDFTRAESAGILICRTVMRRIGLVSRKRYLEHSTEIFHTGATQSEKNKWKYEMISGAICDYKCNVPGRSIIVGIIKRSVGEHGPLYLLEHHQDFPHTQPTH